MASEAEEIGFDDGESPTRQSGVVVRAYAREVEALLARGGDAREAQGLVETVPPQRPPPPIDDEATPREPVVHILVSSEDLAWFPLGREATAIIGAADGRSALSVVLARAGLSEAEGTLHVETLIEMGLLALR